MINVHEKRIDERERERERRGKKCCTSTETSCYYSVIIAHWRDVVWVASFILQQEPDKNRTEAEADAKARVARRRGNWHFFISLGKQWIATIPFSRWLTLPLLSVWRPNWKWMHVTKVSILFSLQDEGKEMKAKSTVRCCFSSLFLLLFLFIHFVLRSLIDVSCCRDNIDENSTFASLSRRKVDLSKQVTSIDWDENFLSRQTENPLTKIR